MQYPPFRVAGRGNVPPVTQLKDVPFTVKVRGARKLPHVNPVRLPPVTS